MVDEMLYTSAAAPFSVSLMNGLTPLAGANPAIHLAKKTFSGILFAIIMAFPVCPFPCSVHTLIPKAAT